MTYSRTQYYSFLRFRYFSRLSIKLTFTFTNLAFMPKIQKSHSSVNLIVTTLEFMGGGGLNFTLNEAHHQRNYQVI